MRCVAEGPSELTGLRSLLGGSTGFLTLTLTPIPGPSGLISLVLQKKQGTHTHVQLFMLTFLLAILPYKLKCEARFFLETAARKSVGNLMSEEHAVS